MVWVGIGEGLDLDLPNMPSARREASNYPQQGDVILTRFVNMLKYFRAFTEHPPSCTAGGRVPVRAQSVRASVKFAPDGPSYAPT